MIARKKDDNHDDIVRIFRDCGARILETFMVPMSGCDFIALLNQRLFIVEVKDGDKVPSARKLTVNEEVAKEYWGENYHIIESADEAIQVVQKRY